jgi:LemA protein
MNATGIVVLGSIFIVIGFIVSVYNKLVRLRNRRKNAFADIDVQLKIRQNLIPQLVQSVQGYMKHEDEVLTEVTRARSAAIDATSISDIVSAENQLNAALSGLKVAVEAYPDLKANTNFMQLQEEISDVENKVAAARRYFNAATRELNNAIETFPSNLLAGTLGFSTEEMFNVGPEINDDEPMDLGFSK